MRRSIQPASFAVPIASTTNRFASDGPRREIKLILLLASSYEQRESDLTIDSHLLEAANKAVAEKRVASLSGWVNLALEERAAKEKRLRALSEAVASYEEEFGEISPAELPAQERADRRTTVVIRPTKRRKRA
jgi:hypothetical protein